MQPIPLSPTALNTSSPISVQNQPRCGIPSGSVGELHQLLIHSSTSGQTDTQWCNTQIVHPACQTWWPWNHQLLHIKPVQTYCLHQNRTTLLSAQQDEYSHECFAAQHPARAEVKERETIQWQVSSLYDQGNASKAPPTCCRSGPRERGL